MELTRGQVLDSWKAHRATFPRNRSPQKRPFVRQLLSKEVMVFDDDPNWERCIVTGVRLLEALLHDYANALRKPTNPQIDREEVGFISMYHRGSQLTNL